MIRKRHCRIDFFYILMAISTKFILLCISVSSSRCFFYCLGLFSITYIYSCWKLHNFHKFTLRGNYALFDTLFYESLKPFLNPEWAKQHRKSFGFKRKSPGTKLDLLFVFCWNTIYHRIQKIPDILAKKNGIHFRKWICKDERNHGKGVF